MSCFLRKYLTMLYLFCIVDEELRKYYDKNNSNFLVFESVLVSSILTLKKLANCFSVFTVHSNMIPSPQMNC